MGDNDFLVIVLASTFVLSLGIGVFSSSKGLGFGYGFWFSLLLSPIIGAIIVAGTSSPAAEQELQLLATGRGRKCPFCAEVIKIEATKCRFCREDLQAIDQAAREAKATMRARLRAEEQAKVNLRHIQSRGSKASFANYWAKLLLSIRSSAESALGRWQTVGIVGLNVFLVIALLCVLFQPKLVVSVLLTFSLPLVAMWFSFIAFIYPSDDEISSFIASTEEDMLRNTIESENAHRSLEEARSSKQ
ncbi:hypothetical protein NA78x_002548 [Anatilimnocola sp. NA78]|uniref:hypothetical protein n=1 Tax=Anatilimnocola sp. NA78 TaxID=3415683 RepID=UPI003CE46347